MEDKTLQAVIKLRDEMSAQLKVINSNLKGVDATVKENKKTMKDYGNALKDVGKTAVGVGGAIVASLGTGFAYSVKQAIDFESAFAGVIKTVDGTAEQLEAISKGLREMSNEMPQSASALAAIAESAGQLGIETDNILDFTKTIAMLGDATNLTGEEGASQLAKFANIVGMSQDNFDRLGSTIVHLGNNMATTEADIVSMAMRLAGAGKQVGLTEAEIMSFSSALSSVGIEAEMGGSAFSKMFVELQLAVETGSEALQDYAKVAGMTGKEFKQAFEKDAAGAMVSFLKGIGTAESRGESAIKVLSDLGIEEIRLRDTILRASSAYELFGESLDMGTQAWQENIALTKEAEQRYGTTESQLAMMRNQINNAAIDIGNALLPIVRDAIEIVGGWARSFSALDPEVKQTIITVGLVALGIAGVLTIGGTFLMFIGGCITAFTTLSAAGITLAGVIAVLTSPIMVVILAIGVLIGTCVLVKKAWESNWNGIRDHFQGVVDTMTGWWDSFVGFITKPVNAIVNAFTNEDGATASNAKRNAYGGKISRNNELRRLHEGERVLTKQEANNYEKQNTSNISINISEMTVREEADINKIANELAKKLKQQRLAFAGAY